MTTTLIPTQEEVKGLSGYEIIKLWKESFPTKEDPDWDPTRDVDDEVLTPEQFQQRLTFVYQMASAVHPFSGGEDEWNAQYGARALYLEGIEDNPDEDGNIRVDEMDYIPMLDSLLEDYAFMDIYENGPESGYSWMLYAREHENSHFHWALNEWRLEQELEPPSWAGEDICYYEDEEDED